MHQYAKAEPLYQQALRIRQKVLGAEDSYIAESLNNLAVLYQDMGEYPQAAPLLQEALKILQKVLGPEHPDRLGQEKWERRYGAVVLFSKGAPIWIPLGKANEIDHLVRRYGTLVRGSPQEEELSAKLRALYRALWTPIVQELSSQIKRIIISPDAQLNFISFVTLLTKDKQFLAQTYSVQYVASGRDLLRELKPSTAREVVLFANPDFDLTSTALLVKAEGRSSNPSSNSIRGDEKRDVEDWSFESLTGIEGK